MVAASSTSAGLRACQVGAVVMISVLLSAPAAFANGSRVDFLFFVVVASLIVPSIVTSLGIALEFRCSTILSRTMGPSGWLGTSRRRWGLSPPASARISPGRCCSASSPRSRSSTASTRATKRRARPRRDVLENAALRHPADHSASVIGVGLFGFTLSWDEIARSSQAMGEHNTLPMELQALTTTVTTPEIYVLGTATTGVSFGVIALALLAITLIRARQARFGSDAGQA